MVGLFLHEGGILCFTKPALAILCQHTLFHHVRSEFFMAVKIQFEVFWIVMPCSVMAGLPTLQRSILPEDGGSMNLWNSDILP